MGKIYALIPARGGSKGLPKKNIIDLCGSPLIKYSIDAALNCEHEMEVFVSSDEAEILSVSEQLGANLCERPPELAADDSTTDSVIEHFIREEGMSPEDIIVLLQPTSPLRNSQHLNAAMAAFKKSDASGMLISVAEPKECIFKSLKINDKGTMEGYFGKDKPFLPRQSFDKVYLPNGAIYIFKVSEFNLENKLPRENLTPYIMDEISSIDIDSETDLKIAEALLKN